MGIFAFLSLYNFIFVNDANLWEVDHITYTFHIVDFSFGFCTKFLPGAIYNIFFDEAIPYQVSIYETILLLMFFAGIAILLEKLIYSVSIQYRKVCLILIAFFITGPCSFAIFVIQLGMLDVYWLFASLLFLIFVTKKKMCLFIPLAFIFVIMVHFSSLLSYVCLFGIIMLYELSSTNDTHKKTFLCVSFFVSIAVTIICVVYFAIYEKSNLTYTMEEFNDVITEKFLFESSSTYLTYYDYALYDYMEFPVEFPTESIQYLLESSSPLDQLLYFVLKQVIYQVVFYPYFPILILNAIVLFLFLIPLLKFLYKYFFFMIKKYKDNKLKIFVLLLAVIQFPFTIVFALAFSPDVTRWISHAFIIFSTVFFYSIYKEKDYAMDYLKSELSKIKPIYIILYFLVYSSVCYSPYI